MTMKTTLLATTMAAGMCAAAVPAHASPHMRIVKCEGSNSFKDCSIITITGNIELADGAEFVKMTEEIRSASIELSSTGGSIFASFVIGERVRAKRYDTDLVDGEVCASACSNIWMAGINRYMKPNTALAFHTPYMEGDPDHADGWTCILQGMYMATLGYNADDVDTMFGHGPHDIHVTLEDGEGHVTHGNGTIINGKVEAR
jgi:hypothetical protein